MATTLLGPFGIPKSAAAAPSIPEALDDRAADNWRPLSAIADRAGDTWPERAHAAALAISGARDEGDDLAIFLLADVNDLFDSRHADKLASNDICAELAKLEGRPWAEYGRKRKPLTPNQLARLLARFDITRHTIRLSDLQTPKGYNRANFVDAFERYLAAQTATTPQPNWEWKEMEFSDSFGASYGMCNWCGTVPCHLPSQFRLTRLPPAFAMRCPRFRRC